MPYPYCAVSTDEQAFCALDSALSPAQKADHIAYLVSKGFSCVAIANKLSWPSYEVRKLARIASSLNEPVKKLLHLGHISLGHARVLAGLADDSQEPMARNVIAKKISVRALEDYKRGSSQRLDTETAAYYQRLSETASEIVGHPMKVTPLSGNKHAGVIAIKYNDLSDFDSVFHRLGISLDNY